MQPKAIRDVKTRESKPLKLNESWGISTNKNKETMN